MKKIYLLHKKVIDAPKPVVDKLSAHRDNAFGRFPLMFTLLGAFGLVATFYGFERIIDKMGFFANHPFLLLGTGLLTLIITGSLYKKL
jgi:hypothetical protein